MSKPIRKLKLKRKINAGSVTSKAMQEKSSMERYFDNLIVGNPQFKKIVEAVREGSSLLEISRWFVAEGWTTVSETSFYRALKDFRSRHPEVMYGEAAQEDLDSLISSNRPNVDSMGELQRLLRLQKKRLYIDFNNEKNINKLFNTMNDEMKETREIVMAIAKLEGKHGNHTASDDNTAQYTPEVRDDLRKIKVNDQGIEQMRYLTNTFIKSFKNAETANNSSKA